MSPLWQKCKRTKEPFDESETGERKIWLKAQHSENKDQGIQSHQFMANRWGNSGKSDRLFLRGAAEWWGFKITANDECSHEIQRRLLLGRKIMTNVDSLIKNRDITLSTKVHQVKAVVFPLIMYGFESLTVKKAEC